MQRLICYKSKTLQEAHQATWTPDSSILEYRNIEVVTTIFLKHLA